MTDQEIINYSYANRSVYWDDLQRDVINTSPQIVEVYRDVWYDQICIITPNNKILFFEKFTRNERK